MENLSNEQLLSFIGQYGEGVSLDYKAEGYDITKTNPDADKKKKDLILDLTAMANSNGKNLAVIITGVKENPVTNTLDKIGIPKGKFLAPNYETLLRHAPVDPPVRFEYHEVEDASGMLFGFFVIRNNIHRPYTLTKDLHDKFKQGLVPFRNGSSNDILDPRIHSHFEIIERWKQEDELFRAPRIRVPDFSTQIAFLTEHFVGRQATLKAIDQFIATHPSGYFAIVGEAGIGKSAVAAWLVKERGYIHHFISAQEGHNTPENFLRSLTGQLINAYQLEHQLSPDVFEVNQVFKSLLMELSQRGQPLMFVVDALDEAECAPGTPTILNYLPLTLPQHVYVIVTSRPQLKFQVQTATAYVEYRLPPFDAADLAAYLRARGQNPALAEPLRAKSEGNPLYLHYVLQTGETLTAEVIARAPRGLQEFYERNWTQFVAQEDNLPLLEARSLLLGLLALLRAPIPRKELIALAQMKTAVFDKAMPPVQRFLRPANAYEIFHQSFRDFLRDKLGVELAAYQEHLIVQIKDWSHCDGWRKNYALAWLPTHLQETDRIDELKNLLLDLNFLEEKIYAYSINETLRDFALLRERDNAFLLLEKMLWLEIHHFLRTEPQQCSFLPQLYSRLAEFYPEKQKLLVSNFQTAFERSRLLPEIWLKRINSCPGRIEDTLLYTLNGHTELVCCIACSPDGKQIASGSEDKTIKLWDIKTGEELNTLTGHTKPVLSIAFSPDGKQIASGSEDTTIKVWDVLHGKELKTLAGHSAAVNSVEFSPDGTLLVSGSGTSRISGDGISGLDKEGIVNIWNLKTDNILKTLVHTCGISTVKFSPDSTQIASDSWDGTIKLWDVKTWKELQIIKRDSHRSPIGCCFAFSPDGKQIVSCCWHTIQLWETSTGRELKKFTLGSIGWSVAFSPDGKTIVSGGFNGEIKLWDITTDTIIQTIWGHSGQLTSVIFSPNNDCLISSNNDRTIKLWDIKSMQELSVKRYNRNFALASDHSQQGIKSERDKAPILDEILWDVSTGKRIPSFTRNHLSDSDSVVSQYNHLILMMSKKYDIEDESFPTIYKFLDAATGKELKTFKFSDYSSEEEESCLSPDGTRIAILDGDYRVIKLCDAATNLEIDRFTGHVDSIFSFEFSPNGQQIVSGGNDRTIRIWDVKNSKRCAIFGVDDPIRWVCFSPDEREIWAIDVKLCIYQFEIVKDREKENVENNKKNT